MYSLNKVQLIGRLTKDLTPEYSSSGTAYARFSIACYEKYKEKETTEFINCVIFGTSAENMAKFARKGMRVYVEGKFKTDTYEQNGESKKSVSIMVNDFLVLSDKKKDEPAEVAKDADEILPF